MIDAFICIDVNHWHRGKESADKDAYIYNADTGKMDVIGFILASYLGLPFTYLNKTRLPSVSAHLYLQGKRQYDPPFKWLVTKSHADTEDTLELIKMNDDPSLKEEERRYKIKTFLAARGVALTFSDETEKQSWIPTPPPVIFDELTDIDEDVWEDDEPHTGDVDDEDLD
jgi:hypothetical protein